MQANIQSTWIRVIWFYMSRQFKEKLEDLEMWLCLRKSSMTLSLTRQTVVGHSSIHPAIHLSIFCTGYPGQGHWNWGSCTRCEKDTTSHTHCWQFKDANACNACFWAGRRKLVYLPGNRKARAEHAISPQLEGGNQTLKLGDVRQTS